VKWVPPAPSHRAAFHLNPQSLNMFKTTHTATKAETYLKVMLDYKINSQQRALLRQVASEILSADGNAYDVAIAFMIGQLNAFSDDYDDPSHAFKIAQYVAEKNIVLSEMNFEATIDWHDEIRSLTQKYVAPQTEEYLSQEENAATPEGEEEPLLLETPTESHGGAEDMVVSVDLREVPDEYLEAAYNEIQNDGKHVATWARAFSKSEGDVSRAEAIYIKDRSEKLFEKAEAERLAAEAEAKRLADEVKAKRLADEAEAKRLADEAKAKRLEREWEEEERQYEIRRLERENKTADEKLRFRWAVYGGGSLVVLILLLITNA